MSFTTVLKFGGKSFETVFICDYCGASETVVKRVGCPMTMYEPPTGTLDVLRSRGWSFRGPMDCLCPECRRTVSLYAVSFSDGRMQSVYGVDVVDAIHRVCRPRKVRHRHSDIVSVIPWESFD